jgi:hypothetical protein
MKSRTREQYWRFVVTAFLSIVACGCGGAESSGPPPQELVFTPTDMVVSSHEPELGGKVAKWSFRYQVEHEGEKAYLSYHEHQQQHRIPGEYPAGSSLTLVDVTTAQGTRTYMHLTRYSRFLLNFGNVLWSALYVMNGDDAVKITPLATMGFMQGQARCPMPTIYIDVTGDLYVLDPKQVIKVVRDGRIVASGDASKLPLREAGGLPRILFLSSAGDERVLCVLKPKPRGIDHVPNEDDFDAKFTIQRP